ncbi:hypothetical protein Q4555_14810 [Octadecabacter sp. 1_MG-2023]|uniref:hypothetical protein n=1 Tax=unclassified Octadecabacter TaxID=196158 RepID=UPI001C08CE58|nr:MULTISPECIES: hypothetical protein [unclassified Octadecabacter]MBU2991973.1 hypothetical protein [Octadecabacter sp. B2R22]MDO6735947.1 hypothetical protein [Octadecabacter sp. 1_MG-2023]
MNLSEIEPFFTRADGSYLCARWGRPIVPVIFGVEDDTVSLFKGAFEAMCVLSGHQMAETDPEFGVNVMIFFCRDWDELTGVKDLDHLVPELRDLVGRLIKADANQYRIFRFDETGAIKACFIFLRMDAALEQVPADALALTQAVHAMVLWSENAFKNQSPLALIDGTAVVRPDIAGVIRAVYDPVMPAVAQDPSHALRLSARVEVAE